MIVIVDNKNRIVYSNLSKTEAAKIVGVNRVTVSRWMKKALENGENAEFYNQWALYFKVIVIKQRRNVSPIGAN